MKKLLLAILFISAFVRTNAQTGVITPSIATGTFVSGISPVLNTFTLDTSSIPPPVGTTSVCFKLVTSTGVLLDSVPGIPIPNGYKADIDMGKADSMSNSSIVYAVYYNGSTVLDSTALYTLNIIPKPTWMRHTIGGYVTIINSTSNPITMTGHLPVYGTPPPNIISGVTGLDNRPYDLGAVELLTDISYDYTNATSTLANHRLHYDLNVFNQISIPISYTLPAVSGITLDNNFNLAFIDNAAISMPPKKVEWPLGRIPTPFCVIKIDGGMGLTADLKGKVAFGKDNASGNYGFIVSGSDSTQITAKVTLEATLRVSADALVAEVSGSVIGRGSIGGGLTYKSFPSPTLKPLFGLSLEIAGAIDYRIGPPCVLGFCLNQKGHYEKTFYQDTWGSQLRQSNPFHNQIYDNVDAMGNYTQMTMTNPYMQVPKFYAQADMNSSDSALYVVWLDYYNTNTRIMFNKLNYNRHYIS